MDIECNICFEAPADTLALEYTHIYCTKCIKDWIHRGQDRKSDYSLNFFLLERHPVVLS